MTQIDPPDAASTRDRRQALAAGALAYTMWGFFGLYFDLLTGIGALTILSHRVIWSLLFVAGLLALWRRLPDVIKLFAAPRSLAPLAVSSGLIAINWLVFIYAATHHRMVAASLGYFLAPLCSVLLGVVVLRERLRPAAIASVVLAAVGVTVLVAWQPYDLWIPLGLAGSFATYGLVRKRLKVSPLVGLFVETALLAPLALLYIVLERPDTAAIFDPNPYRYGWLVLAGLLTAIPLLLFARAARSLRLTTIGFLQYIGPTLQLLAAVVIKHEAVRPVQLVAFGLIWIGLACYTFDAINPLRHKTFAK